MEKYKVTKIIKARPMTFGAFNKLKGDDNTESLEPGYLIGHPCLDNKTFNGEFEGGCCYVSWSPAAAFEGVYSLINDND